MPAPPEVAAGAGLLAPPPPPEPPAKPLVPYAPPPPPAATKVIAGFKDNVNEELCPFVPSFGQLPAAPPLPITILYV